jgi:membrane protease YdiL (CAAX protease family)
VIGQRTDAKKPGGVMLGVRATLRARPLWFFFPLAFLLSWYTWYLRLAGVHTSGGMNPLGVLLAGLIMSWLCGGAGGARVFLGRIVRVRVALRWYGVALLLPLGVVGAAAVLNLLLGAHISPDAPAPGWGTIGGGFLIQLLFVALGEEPGWRGFALVALQKRLTAIPATLVLGAIWALWHLPLMGTAVPWKVVPAFAIGVFAASFVLTWIFNSTDGAVLPCMLLHATVNSIGVGAIFPLFSGASVNQLWWIYTLIWSIAAAAIIWRSGSRLKGWH